MLRRPPPPGTDRERYGLGDAYVPVTRPGARMPWPPSPNWSYHDLIAELSFQRNLAALHAFAVPVPRPTAVQIPAQRRPHQDRWDAFLASSYGAARHGHPPYGAAAHRRRKEPPCPS